MGYEFNAKENDVFSNLVTWAFILGILILTCGGLYLLLSLGEFRLTGGGPKSTILILVFAIAGVVSCVGVSAYLLDAARQFSMVVKTEGNDIEHVLAGLVSFSNMFKGGAIVAWILCFLLLGMLGWLVTMGGTPSV